MNIMFGPCQSESVSCQSMGLLRASHWELLDFTHEVHTEHELFCVSVVALEYCVRDKFDVLSFDVC